ncbi:MAG: response regulator [Sulfurovum sp.]
MKHKILCVDDILSNLFTYETLLSRIDNIEIVMANSGKEALNILLRDKIDLILLDIQMPQMDGYEVAKLIKSNNSTQNIPIVFITAVFKKEEFVAKGFMLGAVDYLTKPLDDNLFLNRIRLYLDIFAQRDLAHENMQRFYQIAQSIGDGLYVLDKSLKIVFINSSALEMLGYRKDELMGKDIYSTIHYRDINNNIRSAKNCKIHTILDSGQTLSIDDDIVVKKDSTSLHVSLMATPMINNHEIKGVVVLFKDITRYKQLIELQAQKVKSEKEMLLALIDMIDKRDSYTAGHTVRVAQYCEMIAKEMGYPKEEIERLSIAASLHDIGKIATPDTVLLKPALLEDDEYKIIQLHLIDGYQLLSKLTEYKDIAVVMRSHHERYDGQGYPDGLYGNEIPKLSRVIILADAFDAMTTNRIYKKKKSVNEALEEIEALSQIQFHPEVVKASLEVLKNIEIGIYTEQLPQNKIDESRYAYYYKDRLTDLFTIEYLPIVIDNNYNNKEFFIYKIQLKNFHQFNLNHSWEDGNQLLINYAKFIKNRYKNTTIFRIEGDDFLIISSKQLEPKDIEFDISNFIQNDIVYVEVKEDFLGSYI